MRVMYAEIHRTNRIGWLRAAVLGANDGVVSVSSLVVGVAASGATVGSVILTGVAGLVAGALSMAAGEYISVQSQADTENADLALERRELAANPEQELLELAKIYENRGLDVNLARQVAEQLTARDGLGAHIRDELGFSELHKARPVQASLASAAAFATGAVVPILAAIIAPTKLVATITSIATIATLAVLGALAAAVGGAPILRGAFVTFWGALAMGVTAIVGHFMGARI